MTAWIVLAFKIVNLVTGFPATVTPVVEPRLLPLIWTFVPATPLFSDSELTIGAAGVLIRNSCEKPLPPAACT